jgi:hypothetical protein
VNESRAASTFARPAARGPLVVPPGAAPEGLPAVPAPGAGLGRRAVVFFAARDVGPTALAGFGLALAGAASIAFLLGHVGMGGLLGLAALAGGELALAVPAPTLQAGRRVPQALNPVSDLLLAASYFAAVHASHPPAVAGLGFLALVLVAWLPLDERNGSSPGGASGLTRRADRLALLLLGALLGRPGPALLVLCAAAGADAGRRVASLGKPVGLPRSPAREPASFAFGPDGSLRPGLRWAAVAAVALLLFLFPVSAAWKF